MMLNMRLPIQAIRITIKEATADAYTKTIAFIKERLK
jgi:hypothetical protein